MDRDAIRAKIIVRRIVQDLQGRSVLGDEWDEISPSVKQEIIDVWETIALSVIKWE